jgi:hypothetical protein
LRFVFVFFSILFQGVTALRGVALCIAFAHAFAHGGIVGPGARGVPVVARVLDGRSFPKPRNLAISHLAISLLSK